MSRNSKLRISCVAFIIGVTSAGVLHAQSSRPPAAPIPTQINAASKVFISNAGGQCPSFGDTTFSGSPDRPYDELYAAMKSWGRYEFASTPGRACCGAQEFLDVFDEGGHGLLEVLVAVAESLRHGYPLGESPQYNTCLGIQD